MPALLSPRPLLLVTGTLAAAALVAASAVPANADPVALTVSVAAPVVSLPVGDGYRDAESLTVTSSAATEASVTLQRAGGEAASLGGLALDAGTTSFAVPTSGLVAGTYTAVVATSDGATASAVFAVQPLVQTVTRVAVQRSVSTVYPVKDGYRDSVVFTAKPTLSAGPTTATVTGTAKLARSGRTVKTWKLHGGANRLVWNGRVGTAVKPGRYALTVTAKGPQGAARTARTTVAVSPKHLVTRTATVTKEASSALQRFKGYDGGTNDCGYVGAFVLCTTAAAEAGAPYAAVVGGTVAVPKAVRAATAFGKPTLRMSLRTKKLTGSATWGYGLGTAHTTRSVGTGTTTGKRLRWSGNPAVTTIYVGLGDASELTVDRFTFAYTYRTLV